MTSRKGSRPPDEGRREAGGSQGEGGRPAGPASRRSRSRQEGAGRAVAVVPDVQVAPPGAESSPARPPQERLFRHVRKHLPFYAIGMIFVLVLVIFPTTQALRDDGRGGAPTGGAGGDPPSGDPAARASALVGTGTTRGGFDCAPGVRQMPWSSYAAQCVGEFSGDNGGSTYRGVTTDTIKIMRRNFGDTANTQAVAAFTAQAGAASPDVSNTVRDVFLDYFNSTFELYGRTVVIEDFDASPQSDATLEAQGRGKEGACVDATRVAQEHEAFGVFSASGPFAECLAERGVVVFSGGAYFPQSWYAQHHPYVWNTVMECERISYQVAEYVGKRLAGGNARWAGDAAMRQQPRRFGTYVPNNNEYQHCVNIAERELQQRYNVPIASRYNYTLDVSRFPDEAARGVLQFRAAGVTTLINACDPISTTFLTQAATAQGWNPEWVIIGVATQDVDSVARQFDQGQVAGSLFGMSQLGDQSKLWGTGSEPGRTYQRITGSAIPDGTNGEYYALLKLFNFLQAAGPDLTPDNMAVAVRSMEPAGAPDYALGYWSFADGPDGTAGAGDNTAINDSREVYWCADCVSQLDGRTGTYVETYGGQRFRNGEWPAEEPPIYPS